MLFKFLFAEILHILFTCRANISTDSFNLMILQSRHLVTVLRFAMFQYQYASLSLIGVSISRDKKLQANMEKQPFTIYVNAQGGG